MGKKNSSSKKGAAAGDDGGSKGAKGGGSSSNSKGAQSINVRHILCEKFSKKEEALAKLKEGVQFNKVAEDFSEDKARQGGSLGWQAKGKLDPEFEKVAFALDTSTTASPTIGEVKTEFGYHIIMVEGKK